MNEISKKNIELSKNTNKEIVCHNFEKIDMSWKDVYDIYKLAKIDNDLIAASFSTIAIPHSQKYTKKYNKFIENFSALHPGFMIQASLLIHIYAYQNNETDDKWLKELRQLYFLDFNKPLPEENLSRQYFFATTHDDISDGFFIQGLGSTHWNFIDEEKRSYDIDYGDAIFIPKTLKHNVLSACPRFSISMSFYG